MPGEMVNSGLFLKIMMLLRTHDIGPCKNTLRVNQTVKERPSEKICNTCFDKSKNV